MQTLLTDQVASLTELKNSPSSVIEKARGKPVAIFNRNHLEGYFVPAEAVNKIEVVSSEEVRAVLEKIIDKHKVTLDYLQQH